MCNVRADFPRRRQPRLNEDPSAPPDDECARLRQRPPFAHAECPAMGACRSSRPTKFAQKLAVLSAATSQMNYGDTKRKIR